MGKRNFTATVVAVLTACAVTGLAAMPASADEVENAQDYDSASVFAITDDNTESNDSESQDGTSTGESTSEGTADGSGTADEGTDTDTTGDAGDTDDATGTTGDAQDDSDTDTEGTDDADSADDADTDDSDEGTMSEEEFWSRFRGTSWRYKDGELIQSQAQTLSSSGVTWTEEDGVYVASNGTTVSGASGIGIDVSQFQGSINWSKVKNAGIDFAIIRCGYGNGNGSEDTYFETNVKACIKYGIPFGIYVYSYCWNSSTAKSLANWVLDLLDDVGVDPDDVDLPIYLDLENENSSGTPAGVDSNNNYKTISTSTFPSLASAFCTAIENAGFESGVYANLNWWNNYLTSSTFDSWSRWVAQYNTTCSYSGDYDYWQRMSSGSVSGISGNVDIDFSYTFNKPSLKTATATSKGPKISWSAVSGASGYAVYRKKLGGSWSMIDTTTSTSYTDKSSLTNGKTYYYTVRAYRGDEDTALSNRYSSTYWTSYDSSGSKVIYTSTPTLSSTSTVSKGIKVSWKSVSGVTGYAVYRKTSGGSWSMIDTTTSTSYSDKSSLSSGKTYYYTVRAYRGSKATSNKYNAAYWSGYDSSGLTAVYLSTPTLSSEKASASGRTVSWKSVSGASGYAVYRKLSGGSWSMIDTTTSTSYTDTASLSAGKTYYYTVRAYKGSVSTAKSNRYSAEYWGHYDSSGLKTIYLATPTLNATKTASKGIKVNWNKVSSATGYAVYRKTSGGSWSIIGTTTSTSYTDKSSLTNGTKYYYTVRAYKGSSATSHKYSAAYWSGYSSSGVTAYYLKAPTLSTVTSNTSGRTVSWKSVSGASGYAVYRKISGGSWSMIDTTTSTSYTDTDSLTSGKTYYYTVRAYRGDVSTAKSNKYSAEYWSHYDTTGLSAVVK